MGKTFEHIDEFEGNCITESLLEELEEQLSSNKDLLLDVAFHESGAIYKAAKLQGKIEMVSEISDFLKDETRRD